MKKLIAFLSFLILAVGSLFAQLTITAGGGTAAVVSAIGGPGLTISNVTITCDPVSYGTYSNGGAGGLGAAMTNGLLLTTGSATDLNAAGVNGDDDLSYCVSTTSSDAQLISVIGAGTNVVDPCIIEFDVVPQCNTLSIRFVFGSDEYTNYVSAGFNDGFGFWVSGPNPAGGNYTNFNMATIPGGTTVSIDNVSHLTNTAYFVNNNAGGNANHFDGYTTVLTPTMNVTACQTYHFKLAIADASDCAMDSGVMIDVIQCVSPWTVTTASTAAGCGVNNGTATATVSGGIGPFSYSWAPSGGTGATATGLAAGSYTVTVNDGLTCTPSQTYTVSVAGSGGSPVAANSQTICAGASTTLTATPTTTGGTYSWAPGGQTTQSITVSPATTTTYTVTYTFGGCNSTSTGTVTVNPLPTVTANSQTICAGGSATLTATPSVAGGTYSWAPGGQTTQSITVSPGTTTTYTVTYTLSGCTNTGTGVITVNPQPTVTSNSQTICAGTSATLTATPSIAGGTFSWASGGQTTAAITVNPVSTTTYTVTYTLNGCTNTGTGVVTVNPMPTVISNSQTICAGTSATLTATPSVAGGTYSWAPGGQTTASITVSPSSTTTYTVTYTLNGCSNTGTGVVTVNTVPTITVNSPTICPGQNATLTATGGTTYAWNTGATTNPITVSPATTTSYTVTGTTNGCSSTAVATVTLGANMTITVNSPTICNGQSATLTATGGTTYSWDTGAATNPITVSPTTTTSYTVTGTTGGCSGTAVATVTVNAIPTVSSTSSTICNGQTTSLTAGGATTYSWNTGATSTTLSVTPSITTTYTVTGTTSGCSNTATGTVTVNNAPSVTVNSPSICPGSSATLTANGAASYTWSTGATTNPISVSPSTTTSYTVTGSTLGCTATAVATVTINPSLTVDAGLNDTICFGATTTLNVTPNTPGSTFAWSPVAGLSNTTIANPSANPATTTVYSVTVTDVNGCSGTDNVTIYVDPQLTLAISGIDLTCNGAGNGQTIVIPNGGTIPYSYSWTGGCTSASCSNLSSGSYTVIVTDAFGCTASADTTIMEPSLLTASITGSTQVTCNGLCNGTATASAVGGTTNYSYSWNTSPVQNTATATGLCAGSYTCTITDANGCTSTTTVTITQPSIVELAPITNTTICNGGSTSLTASAIGGTGPYTYSWSPATGLSATTGSTVSANPTSTTTYTINASDANGCNALPVTVTVTVNPLLSVVASGTASICPGATTPITALASNGNGGPYTYSWSPSLGLNNANASNPTASPSVTTTYTVTANDGCSPAATATVTVTVAPTPTVDFTSNITSGCAPLCVNFTDASTVTGGTINNWNWNFGPNEGGSNLQNPTHCFVNAGVYSISLTVNSNNGCSNDTTITSMITVFANPVAGFSAPLSTSILSPIVQFTNSSSNATIFNWNFGDPTNVNSPNSSTQANPSHTYGDIGTYCITLIASNSAGCTDTTELCIVIDPEFTFFIPNAFSPNGDGVNDEFYGKGEYIKEFEMFVYDRWGNMIFYTDDINKHWDGKANNGAEIAQQDVYVYVVNLKDNKNQKHKYIGTVTIVK